MKKWNKLAIFLIPIGIAVNVVGGQLALMLKVPVFLDCIGTFVVSALCGIVPGLIVAVGTQLINAISTPTVLAYIGVGILFVFESHFMAKLGIWKSLPKAVICGVGIAIIDACICVPITAYLLGGFAGTGATTIAAGLMASGWSVFMATLASEIVSETIDKVVCLAIIFFVLKAIPDRLKVKMPNAKFFIKDLEEN